MLPERPYSELMNNKYSDLASYIHRGSMYVQTSLTEDMIGKLLRAYEIQIAHRIQVKLRFGSMYCGRRNRHRNMNLKHERGPNYSWMEETAEGHPRYQVLSPCLDDSAG